MTPVIEILAACFCFLALSGEAFGSGRIGPRDIYILPPSDSHHRWEIQRHLGNETETRMIALAEGMPPVPVSGGEARGESPLQKEAPRRFSRSHFDGMSVKDFIDLIEHYRKTTFMYLSLEGSSEGDEVGSSLRIKAEIKKHGEWEEGGSIFHDVYVVEHELAFVALRTEGAPFLDGVFGFAEQWAYSRTQRVVLSASGKILSINILGDPGLERKDLSSTSHVAANWKSALAMIYVDIPQAKAWMKARPDPRFPEGKEEILSDRSELYWTAKEELLSDRIASLEQGAQEARDWARSDEVSAQHDHRLKGRKGFRGRTISAQICFGCKEVSVARSWAFMEPVAAGRWSLSIEDPLAREGALWAVAASWIKRDPNGMAKWFRENVTPADKADLYLIHMADQFSESAPYRVFQLLPHFEDDELREIARRKLADRWSYKQPWLAGEMMLEMEPGEKRDKLLKNLAVLWSRHGDAERARAWAKNIPDLETRTLYTDGLPTKP